MRPICVWLELCRGNALYLRRAFRPSANHGAEHAAVKCHCPGAGLGRPESRATDGWGNKKNLLPLSFSEETSVFTVAGNAHLQLLGVQREKKWHCHSLLITSCLGSHQKSLPKRPFLLYLWLSIFSFWEGHDSAATPVKMKWAVKPNVLQTTRYGSRSPVWGELAGYLNVLAHLLFGRTDRAAQHGHVPRGSARHGGGLCSFSRWVG